MLCRTLDLPFCLPAAYVTQLLFLATLTSKKLSQAVDLTTTMKDDED